MIFIRKAEQQLFADFIQIENVPEIMHSYIIPHARRTVYGNARVFVFKQYLETPQFKIWQHHAVTSQISDIHAIMEYPALHLGMTLSSLQVTSEVRGQQPVKVQTGDLNLFYVTQDERPLTIHPGTHCFFNIEIDENVLTELLTQPGQQTFLEQKIRPAMEGNITQVINQIPVAMDAYSSMIIDLIRNPKGGHDYARTMYINKQCKLLLSHFFAQLQRVPMLMKPLTNEDVNNIDSVKTYIQQQSGVVSKEQLSALFGISPDMLHHGFRYLYGTSVDAFIQLWRMEKLAALLTDPDATVMVDFDEEFTRYYNCTPDLFRTL